jgi:hypothetical protein
VAWFGSSAPGPRPHERRGYIEAKTQGRGNQRLIAARRAAAFGCLSSVVGTGRSDGEAYPSPNRPLTVARGARRSGSRCARAGRRTASAHRARRRGRQARPAERRLGDRAALWPPKPPNFQPSASQLIGSMTCQQIQIEKTQGGSYQRLPPQNGQATAARSGAASVSASEIGCSPKPISTTVAAKAVVKTNSAKACGRRRSS